MKRLQRDGWIAGLLALVAGCAVATSSSWEPTRQSPVVMLDQVAAADHVAFPTPVIELRGDAVQLGDSHAQQLAGEIRELHEKYLNVLLQDDHTRLLAMLAAAGFNSHIKPEHRAEINALADGAKVNRQETLLAQCFLDLMPMTACSTITLPAEAAPDHVARFGRNLDFPSLNIADKHTVVLIYHPKDRYQFACISWPGLIGVLSGMNEHGLCLANMEVNREGEPMAVGMPYTLLYRTVLEHCKNVDEAIELLKTTPRQTANNLMLMDADGNRAVVEITREAVAVRRGEAGSALISTNHQRNQDTDTPGLCRRYDALHDLSKQQFGGIDEPRLQKILAAAAQGKMTLQTMVFEPSTRVLYLSAGADAATKPFGRLDLKPYFDRKD